MRDRYILVDVESGEEMGDDVGFSYESGAQDYARQMGWSLEE